MRRTFIVSASTIWFGVTVDMVGGYGGVRVFIMNAEVVVIGVIVGAKDDVVGAKDDVVGGKDDVVEGKDVVVGGMMMEVVVVPVLGITKRVDVGAGMVVVVVVLVLVLVLVLALELEGTAMKEVVGPLMTGVGGAMGGVVVGRASPIVVVVDAIENAGVVGGRVAFWTWGLGVVLRGMVG